MRNTLKLLLAFGLVAGSASFALATQPPATLYGDHFLDYDPVNQSFYWQLWDAPRAQQPGTSAYAAAPHHAMHPAHSQ